MEQGRPSRTAHRVACRRAVHQLADSPKVFDDPLALVIAGLDEQAALDAAKQEEGNFDARRLRAFMAVRSRFAEDELARAITNEVRQYVLLGAGLDTFGYRNPYRDVGLRVFEVDHPATQAWKRQRLQDAGICIPPEVTFAPVDFENESLADGLSRAGFLRDRPAFFSWLGVVPYLTREAFLSTLAYIAAMPPGSGVVFDFAVTPSSLNAFERAAVERLAARVAAAGEPFRLFLDPSALLSDLQTMGFRRIEDLASREINSRYFQGREDGLSIPGAAAHLLSAQT